MKALGVQSLEGWTFVAGPEKEASSKGPVLLGPWWGATEPEGGAAVGGQKGPAWECGGGGAVREDQADKGSEMRARRRKGAESPGGP